MSFSDSLTADAVTAAVNSVVNWQLREYPRMNERRKWKSSHDISWENAIFLTAVNEWAALRGDTANLQWVSDIARRNDYRMLTGVHVYHADNLVVGMLYADLYEQYGDIRVLHPSVARLEFIKNNPSQCTLLSDDADMTYFYKQRWSWCDALFMAPQVFARYAALWNEPALLDFMDREYHASTDYLYSPEYHLYWRDSNYFGKTEANGKPVFWGRGNGWVTAGLARMIPYLPAEWEEREWYIRHFQTMMQAVIGLQSEEGCWHVSMLDPDSYPAPEMSCTGFFCYALWWGINNGKLPENVYLEPATRAWKAMVHAIRPDGRLGYVQAVGEKPEAITADMTEVYGPAAMTFAAMEILKYLDRQQPSERLE